MYVCMYVCMYCPRGQIGRHGGLICTLCGRLCGICSGRLDDDDEFEDEEEVRQVLQVRKMSVLDPMVGV